MFERGVLMTDRPIIETRRDQMFPVLAASEIERIRHYGQVRRRHWQGA